MSFAIEVHQLTKNYGPVRAVDSINLRVRQGEIYGFLGLNGAGKTTTIRALLGMIHPDQGLIKVLGQTVTIGGHGPWQRVGHVVEAPSAYPELTVRENLEVARRLQGVIDKKHTERVIEQLGLSPYANRQAGKLSTGNYQRLGLARALLHQPDLLILDEPASGLDPAGVVEIREMIIDLVWQAGVTVFMSSHILTEVDRIATRIGIIHDGRLVEELQAEELAAIRAKRLTIQTRDMAAAKKVLVQAGFPVTELNGALTLHEQRAIEAPEEIAVLLVNGGAPPTHLAIEQENLENYFLRLTGVN